MITAVSASAPSRLDYGGGTMDIYPLYLFFKGGITINAAINLDAQVWLKKRDDSRITIASLDTGHTLDCDNGLDALPEDGPLALITRALRYYRPEGGLDVKTKLLPPVGSGLGSSSTLFIALVHAILAYKGEPRDKPRIIRQCNGLEAQLMGMPAGSQDYYPPTYGGINAVHYELDETWVEPLDPRGLFTQELQQHVLLTCTNILHHSGTTNWSKIRNFFDKVPGTVECFTRIKDTVGKFHEAFTQRDLARIATLLNEEWENRKGLAKGVTTPEIDEMINAANAAGAWGNKICGAGGGGCLQTIVPPEKRADVLDALTKLGCTYLDVKLDQKGVVVDVTEE